MSETRERVWNFYFVITYAYFEAYGVQYPLRAGTGMVLFMLYLCVYHTREREE